MKPKPFANNEQKQYPEYTSIQIKTEKQQKIEQMLEEYKSKKLKEKQQLDYNSLNNNNMNYSSSQCNETQEDDHKIDPSMAIDECSNHIKESDLNSNITNQRDSDDVNQPK